MVYPNVIKSGDKIGLAAPSGPLDEKRRENIVKVVYSLGLVPVLGKSFYENDDFLAGGDQVRADDINSFFADCSISGIFAVRGGYGSQRMVHLLDSATIIGNPKIFIGYSDITALHIFLNKLGLVTFHGPMLGAEFYRGIDRESLASFRHCIFGDFNSRRSYTLKGDYSTGCGPSKGIIGGGNLSVIASSIGTPYELDFAGKIIFMEDVGEEPYKLDRMLNQLKQCGSLNKAEGYILGHFTDCVSKSERGYTAYEVLEKNLADLGKPCIFGVKAGHELPNLTIPMGAMARMEGENIWIYQEHPPE